MTFLLLILAILGLGDSFSQGFRQNIEALARSDFQAGEQNAFRYVASLVTAQKKEQFCRKNSACLNKSSYLKELCKSDLKQVKNAPATGRKSSYFLEFLMDSLKSLKVSSTNIVMPRDYNSKRTSMLFKRIWHEGLYSWTSALNDTKRWPPNVPKSSYIILSEVRQESAILPMIDTWTGNSSDTIVLVNATDPAFSLKKLKLRLDSQIYAFKETEANTFMLHEIYKIADHIPIQLRPVAIWSPTTGLIMTSLSIWQRRSDLKGLQMTCTTQEDEPYTFIEDLPNGRIKARGIVHDMWRLLETRMNFTTTKVRSVDGHWGALKPDGTMSGLIGMLERREVDVACADLGVNSDRMNAADILVPIAYIDVSLFYKSAGPKDSYSTFIAPFHPLTWAATFLTMLVCWIIFGLIGHCYKSDTYIFDTYMTLITVIHGLYGQGTPHVPTKLSGRIVFLVVFGCAFIVWSSYSACLTSFLAIKHHPLPFFNDRSLYYDSDFKLLMLQGTNFEDKYKSGNELQRRIHSERFAYASAVPEAVDMMAEKDKLAFFWTDGSVRTLLKHEQCKYSTIPQFAEKDLSAMYAQKNWPMTKLFDYHLMKQHESGLVHKFLVKWFSDLKRVTCDSQEMEIMGMDTVSSLFVFHFVIVAMCAILVGLENVYRVLKSSRTE